MTADPDAALREALKAIAEDSPNWMVPDAVLEHAKRMQMIARSALAAAASPGLDVQRHNAGVGTLLFAYRLVIDSTENALPAGWTLLASFEGREAP